MDKIRILWIDDKHSGTLPEDKLPERFRDFFEIVDPRDPRPEGHNADYHFASAKDFQPHLISFWQGNTKLLPCEILATDYDLTKADKGIDLYSTKGMDFKVPRADSSPTGSDSVYESLVDHSRQDSPVNFEGLIISTIFSCLTHTHPSSLVSMTSLESKMPLSVQALREMAEPFVGVNFEQNLGALDKSWENVIKVGVAHLRKRINNLYQKHLIVLYPSDLMALVENADHSELTLRSPHALRKLPVQGLFIDIPKERRNDAIHIWAKNLMRTIMVDCNELRQAQELEREVWGAYRNKDLVKDRKNLSMMTCQKKAGKNINEEEYTKLCEIFGVINNKAKSTSCVDIISTGNYSDRIRRWASLFITLDMLKKLIRIRKHVDALRISDYAAVNYTCPVLTTDDLFLALFPASKGAIVLPWHTGKELKNTAETWPTSMLDWKSEGVKCERRKGDLALSVHDLLDGKGWEPEGPYGITDSERLVLRGFALEDEDFTETDWRTCGRAELVLWGNQQEVENG